MLRGRVLFLDPSLGAASGHHEAVATNYRALLAGREVRFAGHRGGVSDFPVFTHRLEDAFRVSRYAQAWLADPMLARLMRAGARLRSVARRRALPELNATSAPPLDASAFAPLFRRLRACAALDALRMEAGDDVVALGLDPAVLAALHARLDRFTGPAAPRLHLLFMYPEADFIDARTEAAYWSLARDCIAAGARAYAELGAHAEVLSRNLGVPVAVQTTPVRLDALPAPSGNHFVVTVLGAGRSDKAFDFLPALVGAARARAPALRFHIQASAHGAGLERIDRQLSRAPNVTMLPALLSPSDYEAELRVASVLLLAYDRQRYKQRGSGVLADALIGGRPFVCTTGTALARAITDANGIAAEGADGFAQALARVAETYPLFLAGAQRVARRMREEVREGPLVRALRLG